MNATQVKPIIGMKFLYDPFTSINKELYNSSISKEVGNKWIVTEIKDGYVIFNSVKNNFKNGIPIEGWARRKDFWIIYNPNNLVISTRYEILE